MSEKQVLYPLKWLKIEGLADWCFAKRDSVAESIPNRGTEGAVLVSRGREAYGKPKLPKDLGYVTMPQGRLMPPIEPTCL